MSNNTNSYEKSARKKGLLGAINDTTATKHDLKSTAIQTGLELLAGGIAGSFVGTIAGRWSMLVGTAITGGSLYAGSRIGASFGVGIMSAGFYNVVNGVNGLEGTAMDTLKARSKVFADGLKAKFFLDKVLKSKKTDTTTTTSPTPPATTPVNGTEQVRYFMYPQQDMKGPGDLDMSALDRLNAQVAESARQYKAQMKEQPQQVSGLGSALGELIAERIL